MYESAYNRFNLAEEIKQYFNRKNTSKNTMYNIENNTNHLKISVWLLIDQCHIRFN